MDLNRISRVLSDECRLDRHRILIVAVSGGPDSFSLLHILRSLGYQTLPVHLDHQLRPESKIEADQVESNLLQDGFELSRGQEDVKAHAQHFRMTIEEAARVVRYRFLFNQARLHKAQAVVVGHSADDQVETVLMHIIRGTGMDGLKGMKSCEIIPDWDPEIPLVRPLLYSWREEIEAYCQEQHLKTIQDQSNFDTKYFRNRIRCDLIPQLEEKYNPQFKKAIQRLSIILQGEAQILENAVKAAREKVLLEMQDSYVCLDQKELLAQPEGIQRRLLKEAALSLVKPQNEFGFEVIEEIITFLNHPNRNEVQLPGGLLLILWGKELFLVQENNSTWLEGFPQVSYPLKLGVNEEVHMDAKWIMCATHVDLGQELEWNDIKKDRFFALVNAHELQLPLIIRSAKPGDRFKPFGLKGRSMKVSDFFINVKLPRRVRKLYPVVCSGDEIIWIPGYRIAQPYEVTDSTTELLHLEVKSVDIR